MCGMLLKLFNFFGIMSLDLHMYLEEGSPISLFKKMDREDPGNYRDITPLNVVYK